MCINSIRLKNTIDLYSEKQPQPSFLCPPYHHKFGQVRLRRPTAPLINLPLTHEEAVILGDKVVCQRASWCHSPGFGLYVLITVLVCFPCTP